MIAPFWVKSTTNDWLPLETFNIAGVADIGNYIIWHGGKTPRVVYTGQGERQSPYSSLLGPWFTEPLLIVSNICRIEKWRASIFSTKTGSGASASRTTAKPACWTAGWGRRSGRRVPVRHPG